MRNFVSEIFNNPDDRSLVEEACVYYTEEYEKLRKQMETENLVGERITKISIMMPAISEIIQAKWAEIFAIAQLYDIQITAATQKARKHYIENYNRELSASQVNDYAKGDKTVLVLREILISINLIQNKWEGLSKANERLHFQLGNIIKMRAAGLDEMCIT